MRESSTDQSMNFSKFRGGQSLSLVLGICLCACGFEEGESEPEWRGQELWDDELVPDRTPSYLEDDADDGDFEVLEDEDAEDRDLEVLEDEDAELIDFNEQTLDLTAPMMMGSCSDPNQESCYYNGTSYAHCQSSSLGAHCSSKFDGVCVGGAAAGSACVATGECFSICDDGTWIPAG